MPRRMSVYKRYQQMSINVIMVIATHSFRKFLMFSWLKKMCLYIWMQHSITFNIFKFLSYSTYLSASLLIQFFYTSKPRIIIHWFQEKSERVFFAEEHEEWLYCMSYTLFVTVIIIGKLDGNFVDTCSTLDAHVECHFYLYFL